MKKPIFTLFFLLGYVLTFANYLHIPVENNQPLKVDPSVKMHVRTTASGTPIIPDLNGIVYVKANALPGGNGSNWPNAVDSLNTAIEAAKMNTAIKQIWVAAGTYQPAAGTSFFLVNNVKIYGGFAGNETSLSQRILSAGNTSILEGNGINVINNNNNNGLTSTCVLDGFTISGGNADYGGGMSNINVSPAIQNCIFINNKGLIKGGAMYNNGSSPVISNCTFENNNGGNGGGMSNDTSSSPTLSFCNFYENSGSAGGAVQNNENSTAQFVDCIFAGNSASLGGGIQNVRSNPTFTNCRITGNNVSIGQGSGIYNQGSSPIILNCTISGNNALAGNGGAMYNNDAGSTPSITNSIIWGNSDGIDGSGNPQISYSLVQGYTGGGTGNLSSNVNPLFTSAPDYTSAPFTNGNYQLLAGSLCINAGNNTPVNPGIKDLADNTRIVGSSVDLGAYEDQYLVFADANGIVYVNSSAAPGGDGSSWADAIDSLQIPLIAAVTDTSIHQIWVAQGTYSPAAGQSFTMVNHVKIYGSFKGTETSLAQRNLTSVLTSILKGNNSNVIRNDSNLLTSSALLNGFIITGGKAANGGGMYNKNASPTISQCSFTQNTGTVNGGGMFNNGSSPVIINCSFTGNTANTYGGGMLNQSSSPTLINCLFSGNLSGTTGFGGGGGIFDFTSSPTLLNCTIAGNQAPSASGGGINNVSGSSPTLTNCIVWANSDGMDGNNSSVSYSLVQGWLVSGNGNLADTVNPKFTNSPLYSSAPFTNGNYHLEAGSQAINKGNNQAISSADSTDLDGNPRIFNLQNGGIVDMGAYEYQNNPNYVKITRQPSDTGACTGSNIYFDITATGDALQYQWQSSADSGKTWTNITGGLGDTLNITNIQNNQNGTVYRVIVTGAWNSDTSGSALLTIYTDPVIQTQPKDTTVDPNKDATFSVSATGTITGFQWQYSSDNGVTWNDLSGASSDTLLLSDITNAQNGFLYRVIAIGSCANDTSLTGTLNVNPPQLIINPPALPPGYVGVPYSQTFSAEGGTSPYQFGEIGTLPSGLTFSNGIISGNPLTTGTYPIKITVTDHSTGKGAPFSAIKDYVLIILNTGSCINITSFPQSQTVCEGGNAVFHISAGNATGYQWQSSIDNGKTFSNIPGATNDSLVIDNVPFSETPVEYQVIISSNCGNQISGPATLTVTQKAAITKQPSGQTVCDSSDVAFSANAVGAGLSYQWQLSTDKGNTWSNINGATNSTLNLTQVISGDSGNQYHLVVSGTCNNVTSTDVTLQVIPQTIISKNPISQSVCDSSTVSFSVAATGNNLTYQWQSSRDGTTWVNMNGEVQDTLTLPLVDTSDNNIQYHVIVTGTCGMVTSSPATLTVLQLPVIIRQPVSRTVCDSSNASFTVDAGGSNLNFQWQLSTDKGSTWTNLKDSINSTLNFGQVTSADSGNEYRVIVSSSCRTITSASAILNVIPQTVIMKEPANQTVCDSSQASFTVEGSGSNLVYQWQSSIDSITWVNMNGEVQDTLILPTVTSAENHYHYRVMITGSCGNLISSAATLTILQQPVTIQTSPVSQTVCDSSSVSFGVSASGTNLTYQWQSSSDSLNWQDISGAVKNSLTMDTVRLANNAGFYRAIVMGTCESVISDAAKLTINPITQIQTQPVDQIVCDQDTAIFFIKASGKNIQYQWQSSKDSVQWTNITGAITDTLTLLKVDTSENGTYYRVLVTGVCKNDSSSVVKLRVNPLPVISLQPLNDTSCVGQSAVFNVKVSGAGIQYQWQSSPDGKTWTNVSGGNDSVLSVSNVQLSQDSQFYHVLINSACGNLVSDSVRLIVGEIPQITITPQTANPLPVSVLTKLTASGAQSYQWASSSDIQSGWDDSILMILPTQPTTYTVTGTSALGCTSQQSYSTELMTDRKLIVNNIVSPNGDGKNDTWFVQNITSFPNNEVMIYDRAGRMIYHAENYNNNWNGTLNGSPLREGTYYYIFLDKGNHQTFKGFIELLNGKW